METQVLTSSDFLSLPAEQLLDYKNLVEKKFWICLKGEDPWGVADSEIFGAVAYDERKKPVGLALATYRKYLSWATLLSLPLDVCADAQDISSVLLELLEERLSREYCQIVSYVYSASLPQAPQIEALFEQGGWSPPRLFMVRYYFKSENFRPHWLERYQKFILPKEFKIFPWSELTASQRSELEEKSQQRSIPETVSPFHEPETIDLLNSLGVSYKGEVIGWMVTNRIDSETIRYSSFYVTREHRNSLIPICLLARSIALQISGHVKNAVVEFNLAQIDHQWISFAKKRLAPHTESVERLYEVAHYLSKRGL